MKKNLLSLLLLFTVNVAFCKNISFDVVPTAGDDTIPPYDFYAKLNYCVDNTLNFTRYFDFEDTVKFTMSSTAPCTLYIFNRDSPETFSESLTFMNYNYYNGVPGGSNGKFTQQVYLQNEGFYNIVVVSNNGPGGCNVRVQDSYVEDSCYGGYVSENFISCPQGVDQAYNTFTWNSTADMKLCVVSNGRVIAYNDNYNGPSGIDWGTEARIKKHYSSSPSGVIVYAPYSSNTKKTDLYIGCKQSNYALNFPLLQNNDDGILTAPRSIVYNCGSWALGKWNKWRFCFDTLTSAYYGSTKTSFEEWLNAYGYTRGGATEENSVLDLWEYNGEFTHTSVKCYSNKYSLGYGWESKLGADERIMHPRYALTSTNLNFKKSYPYGAVSQYYIKDPYYSSYNLVYENADFTADEKSQIDNMVNSASIVEQGIFLNDYRLVQNVITENGISNYTLLRNNSGYQNIVSLCKANPKLLGLAYQKLSEGDLLPAQIIADVTLNQNEDVMTSVRNHGKEYKKIGSLMKIVLSDYSIATLYVKGLLKKAASSKSANVDTVGSSSIDKSELFQIKVYDNNIHVNFILNIDSKVSLKIQSVDGLFSVDMLNQQLLQKGEYQRSASIFKKGLYVIKFIANGNTYVKKIKIE